MRVATPLLALVLLAACSESGGPADSGPADAGTHDAGGGDAGAVDAGGGDAGGGDAGALDGSAADLGGTDGGAADGGNVGASCGARLGDTCTGQTYCRWELSGICGAADATGTCQLPVDPSTCPMTHMPVCANDGLTYDNECLANAAGVSACSLGPCAAP